MQPAQQNNWLISNESPAEASEDTSCSFTSCEMPDATSEIGVISGVRKILVPVEQGARARDSLTERVDFDRMFDASSEASQLWIEIAPPNQSVALLLTKRSAAELQLKEHYPHENSPVFLNCEDFHRTYNQIVDRGANFLAPPAKMPFGWLSMFEDNEGRRFVLGQW